jgi:hypothetical protein
MIRYMNNMNTWLEFPVPNPNNHLCSAAIRELFANYHDREYRKSSRGNSSPMDICTARSRRSEASHSADKSAITKVKNVTEWTLLLTIATSRSEMARESEDHTDADT